MKIQPDIQGMVVSTAGTLLANMLEPNSWTLYNRDTKQTIKGQFSPTSVERSVGSNYAEITALSRQNPFIQFLNGKTETLVVESMFYMKNMLTTSPVTLINQLVAWTRMLENKRRPPLLTFMMQGWSALPISVPLQMDVILTDVTGIRYDLHNRIAGIRQVNFTMNFMRYSGEPSLKSAEKEVTDTRYARAKEGDYYEALCEHEYGDAMIGVIIAQRNPSRLLLKPGDTVALPALEGVRNEVPAARSLPLRTAFGRKDTLQKRLVQQAFDRHSKPYMSYLFSPVRR